MSKPLNMNIRISEDQDSLLRKIGGHTAGFEMLFNFYLDNYDLADHQEKEINRKKLLKKIGGRK